MSDKIELILAKVQEINRRLYADYNTVLKDSIALTAERDQLRAECEAKGRMIEGAKSRLRWILEKYKVADDVIAEFNNSKWQDYLPKDSGINSNEGEK